MARICLVSCVKKKRNMSAPASELYASAWFAKAREFASSFDSWFILSAKHGLLRPEQIIDPYETSLMQMSAQERGAWATRVMAALECIGVSRGDEITILAGEKYRTLLVQHLRRADFVVQCPLTGLSIGRQLQWLQAQMDSPSRCLQQLYVLLDRLAEGVGGPRELGTATARLSWPDRGVYFFMEPGELRRGSVKSRIVRVGTHGVSQGSTSTLWARLRTHRGTADGVGSHRSSIFRLHVGAALRARDFPEGSFPHWGVGQDAPLEVRAGEATLERLVSQYIGKMQVLYLTVNDTAGPTSDRAYLERNIIGLLTDPRAQPDAASERWLGLASPNPKIRASGLWNLDFIGYRWEPKMLKVLERFVNATLGIIPVSSRSLAPRHWHSSQASRQMHLFPNQGK